MMLIVVVDVLSNASAVCNVDDSYERIWKPTWI